MQNFITFHSLSKEISIVWVKWGGYGSESEMNRDKIVADLGGSGFGSGTLLKSVAMFYLG